MRVAKCAAVLLCLACGCREHRGPFAGGPGEKVDFAVNGQILKERVPRSADDPHGHLTLRGEVSTGRDFPVGVVYVEGALDRNWVTDNPKVEVCPTPHQAPEEAMVVWPALERAWPPREYARISAAGVKKAKMLNNIFQNTFSLRYRDVGPGEKISFRLGFKPQKVLVGKKGDKDPSHDCGPDCPSVFWGTYVFEVTAP